MSEPWHPAQFEDQVQAAIVARLPQPDAGSVAVLRLRLMEEANRKLTPQRHSSPRLAFAMGVLAVLIVLGFFSTSPQAAAAVRHWLGFIPGLGLINERATWYALIEPVSQSRSGVELTVESASSDPDRTVLLIKVEGMVPPLGAPSAGGAQACTGSPQLVVDGQSLDGVGQRQDVWASGYSYRLVFPPMPIGETEAELHIPCLVQVVPGAWPRDWVVPLRFELGEGHPVEPAYEPRLAMERGTEEEIQGVATGTAAPDTAPQTPGPSLVKAYGISPKLEGVVRQPDGLLLFGTISWTEPSILDYGVRPATVTLSDASGRDIPIEPAAPDESPAPGSQRTAWAFHAMGTDFPEPLTLTFHSFLVDLHAGTDFDVELGAEPQSGQTFPLDRRFDFGLFDLRLVSAQIVPGDSEGVNVKLTLDSDSGTVGALVYDRDHPQLGGGGGGGVPTARQTFTANLTYPEGVPANVLHLSIGRIAVLVDEISSITWSEPAP
jgi:hypothetical protein